MQTPDPDKLARLPKWARDYITGAEGHIVRLESQRDALAGSPEGRIVVTGHQLINGVRPVVPDDRDQITWRLGQRHDDVSVSYTPASESADSLPCVTIQTGHSMVIRPHSSNVISLRPENENERIQRSENRDRYREAAKKEAGL